jgi:hypothetical protein
MLSLLIIPTAALRLLQQSQQDLYQPNPNCAPALPCLGLQDPLGIGRSSNDNANARSLAMAYNSLAKVLAALRHSAPAAAGTGASVAVPAGAVGASAALAAGGLAVGQQQHVPWRDSPLTRWLQERLHAASAITMLGTVSASTEVRPSFKAA